MNSNFQGMLILMTLMIGLSFLGNPKGFKQLGDSLRNVINDFKKWMNRL